MVARPEEGTPRHESEEYVLIQECWGAGKNLIKKLPPAVSAGLLKLQGTCYFGPVGAFERRELRACVSPR